MIKKLFLALLAGVWIALGLVAAAYGENGARLRAITLAELGYSKDETLQGVRATREYGLVLPDAWQIQADNALVLRFSHSPALRPNSSLAVDWNGTRLTSVLLTSENVKEGMLRVTIPGALIRPGYNSLRVETFMGIQEDFCADIDNPAVWVTVHGSSYFEVAYIPKTPEPELSKFPLPFIDSSPLVTNTVTFVLPSQPRPAELGAVAAISAKLGQLAAWRSLQLDVRSLEQGATLEGIAGHLIVVGSLERLPLPDATTLPIVTVQDQRARLTDLRGNALPAGAGVVWEQLAPGDRHALMLVVTGDSEAAMLTAAHALASAPTYARLRGQLGVVLQVPAPANGNGSVGQTLTLEELGYRDVTSQGSREQTSNFVIPLPMAWQIQDEATLDLRLAHSELLDANKSSLNVLLNDTPVGSILLTPKNAAAGRATFALPARLFRMGENKLTIASNIQIARAGKDTADCLNTYYREAWLVVYANSRLNLPGGPASLEATLSNYPRAFIGSANFSDLAFVVPRASNLAIARALARIAGRLGRFAEGETLAPVVVDAPTPAFKYQILVGRPSQNEAMGKLQDALPQPFKPNSDEPEPVAQIAQVMPPYGAIGYLQATTTSDGQPRLVVTGNSDEGVLWAAEALSASELLGKLRGDLAILSAADALTTLEVRVKDTRAVAVPSQTAPAANTAHMPGWALALTAGLFLLTFVILLAVGWQVLPRYTVRREREL